MPETDKKLSVFVAMPISVKPIYKSIYQNEDHFTHVYRYIYEPAITSLGHECLPPFTREPNNITLDIFTKIVSADIMIADASAHNANVFLEAGIRTALDKPVIYTKDQHTEIPFDVASLSFQPYDASLHAHTIEDSIQTVKDAITSITDNGVTTNQIWSIFSQALELEKGEISKVSDNDKIGIIYKMLQSLIDENNKPSTGGPKLLGKVSPPLSLESHYPDLMVTYDEALKELINFIKTEESLYNDEDPGIHLKHASYIKDKISEIREKFGEAYLDAELLRNKTLQYDLKNYLNNLLMEIGHLNRASHFRTSSSALANARGKLLTIINSIL